LKETEERKKKELNIFKKKRRRRRKRRTFCHLKQNSKQERKEKCFWHCSFLLHALFFWLYSAQSAI